MRYEEFKTAWDVALRESRLPSTGQSVEELDLRTMDRRYEVHAEPLNGQGLKPFHITAKFSWQWTASLTARTATTEEDNLMSLLGTELPPNLATDRPWLRVDITLHASAPYEKPLPFPTKNAWARWGREVIERLERSEPVVPEDNVRETPEGQLQILAWSGQPEVQAICGADGELRLEGVKLSAWQAIELPRQWDDSEREPDEDPHEQLRDMFGRVKASLHAWMEVMDHLL